MARRRGPTGDYWGALLQSATPDRDPGDYSWLPGVLDSWIQEIPGRKSFGFAASLVAGPLSSPLICPGVAPTCWKATSSGSRALPTNLNIQPTTLTCRHYLTGVSENNNSTSQTGRSVSPTTAARTARIRSRAGRCSGDILAHTPSSRSGLDPTLRYSRAL